MKSIPFILKERALEFIFHYIIPSELYFFKYNRGVKVPEELDTS
jgi:hypothetical protein